MVTQTVFVTHQQAQETLRMTGATTFYVIAVREGQDPEALEDDIETLAAESDTPIVAHTRRTLRRIHATESLATSFRYYSLFSDCLFIVGLAVVQG